MQFNYEKLQVTARIHELIKHIYSISSQFPDSEKFGLRSQLQRSVTSILLNLAEGSGRSGKTEFARFIRISIGSLIEVDAILKIAESLNYISQEQRAVLDPLLEEIFAKLQGLRRSQSS